MSYDSNYDDVQEELHRMRRANKEASAVIWLDVSIAFALHVVVLAVVVWGMGWVFGSTVMVIGVTCAAYTCAVIGWAVEQVQKRVNQMAVHATSIHDEVLAVKELIQDEQSRSVQWP